MPLELTLVQKLAVWALPMLFAITVPEMARAFMAHRLGDNSGRASGQLSFNPLSYVDPIGTLVFPALMIVMGGNFMIGWPKAVPINYRGFRHPLTAIAYLALSTLLASLAMAFIWALLLKVMLGLPGGDEGILFGLRLMSLTGVWFNLMLMVFFLLPLPPLPGGHILLALLPPRAAYKLASIEPYSMLILFALLLVGVLNPVVTVPASIIQSLLLGALGIT